MPKVAKTYEVEVKRTVRSVVTVRATSEDGAFDRANEGDWIDERELEQTDWEAVQVLGELE